MSNHSRNKLFLLIILLFPIFSFACDYHFQITQNKEHNNCEYSLDTKFNSYTNNDEETKYVYVLLDQSFEYEFLSNDLEILKKIIDDDFNPGDRLVISLMNLDPSTNSIIFDDSIGTIPFPDFMPTFQPPMIKPTMTPVNMTTSQGNIVQTNQAIDHLNTESLNNFYCDIGELNFKNEIIFTDWQEKQTEEISRFCSSLLEEIENINNYDRFSGKMIYDSLATSTQMLQNSISKSSYDEYYLLVFSDMYDWRPEKPQDLVINLQNINTLIISQNCKYDIDCCVKKQWDQQLNEFSPKSLVFLTQEDNISNIINDCFYEN